MSDLAGLIAPGNFLIVAGKEDHLAKYTEVEKAYLHASRIFKAAKSPEKIFFYYGGWRTSILSRTYLAGYYKN